MPDLTTIDLDKVAPVPPAAPPQDRVTEVYQLYYEAEGVDPVGSDWRESHALAAVGEEPYTRRIQVGTNWGPLDYGWLDGSPLAKVVLENQATAQGQRNPSPGEVARAASQYTEVAFGDAAVALRVRPGGHVALEPADPSAIRVRCPNGPAPAL